MERGGPARIDAKSEAFLPRHSAIDSDILGAPLRALICARHRGR